MQTFVMFFTHIKAMCLTRLDNQKLSVFFLIAGVQFQRVGAQFPIINGYESYSGL